jgi:hypothetical protein
VLAAYQTTNPQIISVNYHVSIDSVFYADLDKSCIDEWLSAKTTCPVCTADARIGTQTIGRAAALGVDGATSVNGRGADGAIGESATGNEERIADSYISVVVFGSGAVESRDENGDLIGDGDRSRDHTLAEEV